MDLDPKIYLMKLMKKKINIIWNNILILKLAPQNNKIVPMLMKYFKATESNNLIIKYFNNTLYTFL